MEVNISDIPKKVIQSAKNMVDSLDLKIAEIRMIITPKEEYIFLWFNFSPIWSSYMLPKLDNAIGSLVELLQDRNNYEKNL